MDDLGKKGAGGSIGLSTVVGIVFIVLKLMGVIDWSWVWVLAPFWMPFLMTTTIILIYILGGRKWFLYLMGWDMPPMSAEELNRRLIVDGKCCGTCAFINNDDDTACNNEESENYEKIVAYNDTCTCWAVLQAVKEE